MVPKITKAIRNKVARKPTDVPVRTRQPHKRQGRVVIGGQLKDSSRLETVRARRAERLQDTKRAQRLKMVHRKHILVWAAITLLVGAFVASRLFITSIAIQGVSSEAQIARYQSEADEYFTGLGSRFKPTFDREAFEAYFLQKTSDVSSIETAVGGITTNLYIEVAERTNTVGWIDQRRDSYFLIDTEGFAYEQVDVLPQGIPVVTDVSGIKVVEGDQVVSLDTLSFLRDLYDRSTDSQIPVSGFILDDTTRDIEATLEGYVFRVKFTTNRTPVDQVQDLKPVLRLLEGEDRLPDAYIDVRVADKVFYK